MCETEISNWELRVVFVLLSHDYKLNNSAKSGSLKKNKKTNNLFLLFFSFFVSLFHSTAMLCCVGSCVHLFLPFCQHLDLDVSHRSCPYRPFVFLSLFFFVFLSLSLSFFLLIGPGLPLPTDAAPPTTAQCIRSAAPRDCPRTSQSLFPHSSSLVRRGRKGNRCRRKAGNQKCSVAIKL